MKSFRFTLLFSILSLASQAHAAPFVIGFYSTTRDPMHVQSQFILNRDARTNTWVSNTQIKNIPAGVHFFGGETTTCQGKYCLIAGQIRYDANNQGIVTDIPFSLYSEDSGLTWSADSITLGLPADFRQPLGPISTNCFGDACFMTASYLNQQKHVLPLLLRSQNHGKTWHYMDVKSLFSANADLYEVSSLACHEQNCIASSRTITASPQNKNKIKLIQSKDNGRTWQAITLKSPYPNASFGYDNIVNYHHDQFYLTSTLWVNDEKLIPYIARSKDNGRTWQQIKDIPPLPLPSERRMNLNNMTCHDTTCMISVNTENAGSALPVLLLSHDNGAKWNALQHVTNFPAIAKNIYFYSTFYHDAVWSISGHYTYTLNGLDRNKPFILNSRDNGKTWTFASITMPESILAFLTDVECYKKMCVAIVNNAMTHDHPVLESTDNGQTWTAAAVEFPAGAKVSTLWALKQRVGHKQTLLPKVIA